MGFNKRYLTPESICHMAKISDFESFNLYMTNSDAHCFMNEVCEEYWKKYVDMDMNERKQAYAKLKSGDTTEILP